MKQLNEYSNQFVFIPFNDLNIKFFLNIYEQKDSDGKVLQKQILGFRILINTNYHTIENNQNVESTFPFQVQIIQQAGEVVKRVKVSPNSYKLFQQKALEIYNKKLQNDSSVSKYFINENEVTELNKKKENQYTILEYIQPTPQNQQEQQQFDQFSKLVPIPDESDLILLTDFSNLNIDYRFRQGLRGNVKTNFKEIRDEVNEIFKSIDEDMAKELRIAFAIDAIINEVENLTNGGGPSIIEKLKKLIHKQVNLGAILHGPPGTGKTRAVELTVSKIFKDVFGYNVTVIPMDMITEGGSYYGALMMAVTRIFHEAIKDVQTGRPTLLFIDEADRLVENTLRDDDNAGIAALKNYLNPTTYPGIYSCFITNLDKSKINTGIVERRLVGIYYGYPGLDICKQAWEFHIKTKIFGFDEEDLKTENFKNFKPKFKDSSNSLIESNEAYSILGKLVAKNIGLDNIDGFCKEFGRLSKDSEIDFSKFELNFYIKTLGRLKDKFNETMTKAKSENIRLPVSEDDSLKYIEDEYDLSVKRLELALKGKDETELKSEDDEIRRKLNLAGTENIYVQKYIDLYNSWLKILNRLNNKEDFEFGCVDDWKKIYESSKFLINKFEVSLKLFRFKDENFFKNLYHPFINSSLEASKFILSKVEDVEVLKSHPTLIGLKNVNNKHFESFLVNFTNQTENLKHSNIFLLGDIKTKEELIDKRIPIYSNIINRAEFAGDNRGIEKVAIPLIKDFQNYLENYVLLFGNKHTKGDIDKKKGLLTKLMLLYQKKLSAELNSDERKFISILERKIISLDFFKKPPINL